MKDKHAMYDHRATEAKWSSMWRETQLDSPDIRRSLDSARDLRPFYNLMMFPYPSAEGLHVGNMYAFTGSDIYGRFKRMQGYNVLEPIGLDGFGIHSENYALKIGKHPMDQAKVSQKNFYRQLGQIGAMFDWNRTLETYDPAYYRWTQWLFVQMFTHGLAYRDKAEVNWCPKDKTVLADEQVIDGKCERCGNTVVKKLLEQWFFRITAYAGKLLGNIPSLDWSEKVKVAQTNWIGKKEGIIINYPIIQLSNNPIKIQEAISVFTTRPDTNFGATFVVIAPEHPLVTKLLDQSTQLGKALDEKNRVRIAQYRDVTAKKTPEERIAEGKKKTGVATGLYCVNQLNGYKMPLYVSDFVLMGFGTGAVVGVPGHDVRDFDFAIQFDIPIKRVVAGRDGDTSPITKKEQVQEEEGKMINSEFLDGLDIHEATRKMMDYLEEKGWGKRVTTYHLRDWLISRQRYWGPPIPMVYCSHCAADGKSWFTSKEATSVMGNPKSKTQNPKQAQSSNVQNSKHFGFGALDLELAAQSAAGWYPVNESELPVLLPRIEDYKPGDDGVAPLAKHKEFYETTCPGCGGAAVRETDVSDTFLDSSWYFLRYPSLSGPEVAPESSRAAFLANENLDPSSEKLISKSSGSRIPKSEAGQNFVGSLQPSLARAAPKQLSSLEIRNLKLEIPWDPQVTRRWLPVHMYTGGAEHSVLHLLYSRFVTMALHDWGYLEFEEPFTRFYAHGLVIKDGAKMSKSKGNVVAPDEYIASYGADALRLYLMFMGPFDAGGDFRDTAMEGMSRWVGRVWRLSLASLSNLGNPGNLEIKKALHKLVKKVTDDIEKRRYNTAIAAMMEFTQHQFLKKTGAGFTESQAGMLDVGSLKTFILLLAPFAPYLAEELWQRVRGAEVGMPLSRAVKVQTANAPVSPFRQGRDGTSKRPASPRLTSSGSPGSVHLQPWPSFDASMLVEDSVEIIVQVNGKLRDTISMPNAKCQMPKEVESEARKSEKVRKYLEGQTVKKVIFVSGKLINFVV